MRTRSWICARRYAKELPAIELPRGCWILPWEFATMRRTSSWAMFVLAGCTWSTGSPGVTTGDPNMTMALHYPHYPAPGQSSTRTGRRKRRMVLYLTQLGCLSIFVYLPTFQRRAFASNLAWVCKGSETPSESSNILQSSNPVLKATGVPISHGHKSLCVAASLVAHFISTRTMTSGVMGGMLLKQPGENLAFKGSTPWLTGAPCTSPVKDIGNKVSFAAFAAHLWKLAGLHCWLHGQCGIHCRRVWD